MSADIVNSSLEEGVNLVIGIAFVPGSITPVDIGIADIMFFPNVSTTLTVDVAVSTFTLNRVLVIASIIKKVPLVSM